MEIKPLRSGISEKHVALCNLVTWDPHLGTTKWNELCGFRGLAVISNQFGYDISYEEASSVVLWALLNTSTGFWGVNRDSLWPRSP